MTTITLLVALSGCLLLHLFVLTTIAASVPNSDLPFEFNYNKGSIITDDNVLTQSVSSDGKNILKINSPQPIKKYQSVDKNPKTSYAANQNSNKKKKQMQYNSKISGYEFPAGHKITSHYSNAPKMPEGQWFFENFGRYFPGLTNMRIIEY